MLTGVEHRSTAELDAGLDDVRRSPLDRGRVELVVRRPARGEREVLAEGALDPATGLVGDTWAVRPSRRTADRSPHPQMQLTLMNVRAVRLVAGPADRWPLAGDQLYVDLDLSQANLPAGTRLAVGTAVVEISPQPHPGCAKFAGRFGSEAARWVQSPRGLELRLRGVNARVVQAGTVRPGDRIARLPSGGGSDTMGTCTTPPPSSGCWPTPPAAGSSPP